MNHKLIIFGLIYLGAGVANMLFHPRLRSAQTKYWSFKTKGYKLVLNPLCGVIAFSILVFIWPFILIWSITDKLGERKLKKEAELYGMKFGGGATPETAIVIVGANNFLGVLRERRWLGNRFPGHRLISQEMFKKGDQTYDKTEIEMKSGERATVYFNITNFFGTE